MKQLVGIALAVAILLPASAVGSAQTKTPRDAAAVIERDLAYWRAYLANDSAAFDEVVADDAKFQANGDNRDKKSFFTEFEANKPHPPAPIENLKSDSKVRFAGNRATISGILTWQFPDKGRTLKDSFQFVNVYENRGGKWMLVDVDWSRIGAESAPGKRGIYFAKKRYSGGPLPTYAASKDKLPVPVLGKDKGWIDMYWKCWELAFKHLKKPRPDAPLVSNFLDEAFNDSIFQWDTIFMVMFARYGHHVFPAIQSLDNFYARQHVDGFICREIGERDGSDIHFGGIENTINPPLFSWAEVESYKVTGDKSRFRMVLPVMEKYVEWLEKNRTTPGAKHTLYWQTPLGSGMDNSPRTGSGWVDMSCQMVMNYNDMATMSDALGQPDRAKKFRARAAEIGKQINELMWNEEDGLYYDIDDDAKQVKSKTSGCFWPMLAGIASKQQSERLVANLKDPNTFWRKIPFPTLAAGEPEYSSKGDYWKGSVWAPTNLAIIKGLEHAGYDDFAAEATEKYLEGMYQVFLKTGTVWENYSPDMYEQGNQAKPDFVGWTGDGPIAMLIENVIGLRSNGADSVLTWHLRRLDRHGVEKLRFGAVTASVICEERASADAPAQITVTCDRPFTLKVLKAGGEKTLKLKAGKQTVTV